LYPTFHVVIEEGIAKGDDDKEIVVPIGVVSLVGPTNVVYNRLILLPCGHVECGKRFEMSLN